ncbi:hypothetical protein TNCV_1327321 [Trichonephila clavipes]|nr:hypothetical protein TNCV_1327321 [Trichonephila clavipes]
MLRLSKELQITCEEWVDAHWQLLHGFWGILFVFKSLVDVYPPPPPTVRLESSMTKIRTSLPLINGQKKPFSPQSFRRGQEFGAPEGNSSFPSYVLPVGQ